jgi:hypothetical protein
MSSADKYPSTTVGSAPLSVAEQRAQLEKVLSSKVFRSAPALCKFLEHIALKLIEGASDELKESTIGAEVFGRPPTYDPRIDTVVRVAAHRLREKLKQYYDEEGAEDEILLVMPRGHYIPEFSRRVVAAGTGSESSQPSVPPPQDAETLNGAPASQSAESPSLASMGESRKRAFLWFSAGMAGMALLLGLGLLITYLLSERSIGKPSGVRNVTGAVTSLNDPLRNFWADFLKDESSPIVVYSNSIFLATESSDLLRVNKDVVGELGALADNDMARRIAANTSLLEHAGPLFFNDSYTGTGEVMAVYSLACMFTGFNSTLGVMRSRLVTAGDLKRHDLIILGSIREDALVGLPATRDFVFVWPPKQGAWGGRILNLHPLPGESSFYGVERDPNDRVVQTDYALVSFLPGLVPARKVAVLGGLTTIGTQAAAAFVTSPAQISELAARLGTSRGTSTGKMIPPYFQAVLRVDVVKGDILNVKYVTGHVIAP